MEAVARGEGRVNSRKVASLLEKVLKKSHVVFSVTLPPLHGEKAVFQERPLVPYKVSQTLGTEGSVFFFNFRHVVGGYFCNKQ